MAERETQLERLPGRVWDALVVGGGINGAVSAAALSRRGANVALIERGDFAGFTSQQSSNLVWGGIKYLETWELGLVWRLCQSRNDLIREYPSSIKEISFLSTVPRGFRYRPSFLWLGTWVYWLIGRGFTRMPKLLSKAAIRRLEPVIDISNCRGGFEYSDAYLSDNDARFVFGFVRDALDSGCAAVNYVEALQLRREGDLWITRVRDTIRDAEFEIRSKVVVNAAGAFVDRLNQLSDIETACHHKFSKGIHLIVDRITPSRRVLAFFAADGRLFFAIPMGSRTCIGTTDTSVDDPVTEVTPDDRRFVLDNINRYLVQERRLSESDIIAERCGVRPLAVKGDEAQTQDFLQLSRRHVIEVDKAHGHLSIFGGKLTDCINVGEEVCEYLGSLGVVLPRPDAKWYGEPASAHRAEFFR
ncbi:MAG: FAD-dependent oxidoreductase, partial [Pseudomonadota bacterium]|nr:FAD-dependent oxidoreductase [Pseudomonadota bacterium]